MTEQTFSGRVESQREAVAEALYDYLLGRHKPRPWPAPEQHMPWWLGLADAAIAALAPVVVEAKAEAWDEGATEVWRSLAAHAWSLEFYTDDNPYRAEQIGRS